MDAEPNLAPRPVRESYVEMTELVLPNDTNSLGSVLGGRVMHLIDVCGALAAVRHCRRPVVTASVDALDFKNPIVVGQAMILRGWVNYAGRTSMEVQVEVYAEDLLTGHRSHTSTALLTFVALDASRRPAPVPPVLPETEEERRRYQEAQVRRAERVRRVRGEGGPEQPLPSGLFPPEVADVLAGLEARQREIRRLREQGELVTPLWCLPRDGALLLHILVRAVGARRVVEVGTSAGYSGTWIAAALPPDGRLYTVEVDPEKVAAARGAFARAGLADRVEIVEGEALAVLPRIAAQGPFDLVFLDARKDEYVRYFDLLAPALRPGGLVVADNVISHAPDLDAYLRHVRRLPGFASVTLPLGNGLEITCKVGSDGH